MSNDTNNTAAPAFVMDFTASTGPAPVSDGMHQATIVEAKPSVSKAGNPMISIVWKVVASADPSNVNRKVFDYPLLTPEGFWKMINILNACQIDVSQWHGKPFTAEVQRQLADALIGETINILTAITASTEINKATNEKYPDSATVKKYLPYADLEDSVADLLGD